MAAVGHHASCCCNLPCREAPGPVVLAGPLASGLCLAAPCASTTRVLVAHQPPGVVKSGTRQCQQQGTSVSCELLGECAVAYSPHACYGMGLRLGLLGASFYRVGVAVTVGCHHTLLCCVVLFCLLCGVYYQDFTSVQVCRPWIGLVVCVVCDAWERVFACACVCVCVYPFS